MFSDDGVADPVDLGEFPTTLSEWEQHGISTSKDAIAFTIWTVCGMGISFPSMSDTPFIHTLKTVGVQNQHTVEGLSTVCRNLLREDGVDVFEVRTRLFSGMRAGYEPKLFVNRFEDTYFNDDDAQTAYQTHVLMECMAETLNHFHKHGHPAVTDSDGGGNISVNMELLVEMDPDIAGILMYLDSTTTVVKEKQVLRQDSDGVLHDDVPEEIAREHLESVESEMEQRVLEAQQEYAQSMSEGLYDGADIDGVENDDDPFGGEEE